ncbi:MAG: hypothetical protein Kow0098_05380 [Ignavibacteriaceae bacterium]
MSKTLILLIFTSTLFTNAQIDSTLKDYFPLEIGNYWEYRDNLFNLWTIEAVGDTVMPNGKTYTIMRDSTDWIGGSIHYSYYRWDDSLKVWQYVGNSPGNCDNEWLIFDLNLPDSTGWTTCINGNIDPSFVFPALLWTKQKYYSALNLLTIAKVFSAAVVDSITGDTCYCGSFEYPHHELAKGIGIAYRAAELGNAIYITGAIIRGVQYGTIVSVEEGYKPFDFTLFRNYPNPFNPTTTISYSIPENSLVQIKVYDILGNELAELINEIKPAGNYQTYFDASALSSGVYIYRLTAIKNGRIVFTDSKQMILMK